MLRTTRTALVVAGTLAATTASASAAPPSISTVGQQSRHPDVSFSAPRAATVTVYIASRPDRATDGMFLRENAVKAEDLTDDEILLGRWLDASQLDPGSYSVMVQATPAYSCVGRGASIFDYITDPSCADGFSSVLPLTVPRPKTTYTVMTRVLGSTLYFTLTGSPLGDDLPYRVCWRQPKGKRRSPKKRCVLSTLDGSYWDHDATDVLRISTTGMSPRTTFRWSTRGTHPKPLLSRTITVH